MNTATMPQELATRMVDCGLSTYALAQRLQVGVGAIRSALSDNWHHIDPTDASRIRSWLHHPATSS